MIRVPGSTYRLQLHKDFGFDQAAAIAPYLKSLGITHVYSSPYLQASPGSMHGYDVVDHRRVNEELGGEEAHVRFCKKLGEAGLGQILDIVPNHMSLGKQNRLWWDVLENGSNSRYASFFDIDWEPQEERLRNKVLVPILADQYGRVLKSGGVRINRNASRFTVKASEQELPVAPTSLPLILNRAAEIANSDTLRFISSSYGRLPSADDGDRRTILARHRDKIVLHKMLERLCRDEDQVCEAIDQSIQQLNGDVDSLDFFLQQQNYRLSYWKTADQQLGYRRFFDVNTLIGLRTELEYVFSETHELILKWLESGLLDGVRVDHPDGLRDPKQYFHRLRARAPKAWIIGEKILEPGEWMRPDWKIEGTSGYDFLNQLLGLLVKPDGVRRLREHYVNFTGDAQEFPVIAHDKKLAVAQEALGSDVNRLASIMVNLCEGTRDYRDFTRAEIRRAIREVASCFSTYRTYVVPDRNEITDEDRQVIREATECAENNRTDIDGELFEFIRQVLSLERVGKLEAEFAARFQQFTSPVMAKGVEDTAFYDYNALTALSEVGGNPACTGFTLEQFHAYNTQMQNTFPSTMTTLSTHDTKRADDVRARLCVLSEEPDRFMDAVLRWQGMTVAYRDAQQIDQNTAWFFYQTLVGAWPIDADRLKAYMQKAMREAKLRTTWTATNIDYEQAVVKLIDGALADKAFCDDLSAFVDEILEAGRINSLTQTLLKHTSPGVPDMYQGGELWDLSLVDPDNRRPVDYAQRAKLLKELKTLKPAEILARMDEGLPKLWVVHRALTLRAEDQTRFEADAAYTPVHAQGDGADHIIAYLRGDDVLTVAPRWTRFNERCQECSLTVPQGSWTDRLSGLRFDGGTHKVAAILKDFPVALLVRD